MKTKISTLILVIFFHAAPSASICSPKNIDDKLELILKPKFECLPQKTQTLINECASFHKIKISNNCKIIEPPKSKCENTSSTDCSLSILEKSKYDINYGAKTNFVVEIYKLETNRFGEKITAALTCGWSGTDYKIFKINSHQ